MSIVEWAVIGALFLGIMIFCARIMRKGISTLDENRRHYMERIQQEERKIDEDRKNITAREHLGIMRAAMDDLLRLDGFPAGCSVEQKGNAIEMTTPGETWRVELLMRERGLKSSGRVLHGRSSWRLSGGVHDELHPDPASLMRSLNRHLHEDSGLADEPGHLARRLAHLPQEPV